MTILVIFPGQDPEKRTASIKSILSGSPREQLVAYGVLATSSHYCSASKTVAATAVLFCSLQRGSEDVSTCLFLFGAAAVIT